MEFREVVRRLRVVNRSRWTWGPGVNLYVVAVV